MSDVFLTVVNMSLTASYVILFVVLFRLLLKRAPKVISYTLWCVVALRLIIPFSFESVLSLLPRNANAAPIPHDIIYQKTPQINSGIQVVDTGVNKSLPAPTIGASANPMQIYIGIGALVWLLGIIALLVYSIVSILILKRKLRGAQLIESNIYEAKNLQTPFVLGLIRPRIYLPVGLDASERNYILLHEQTHIHRKDYIVKVFAFLILSIHWFNPLVWIAFMLMSKDMELSCDERVLKEIDGKMDGEMAGGIKKPYANSLLSLACGKRILNGSPLAFGEGNVRGRIKNVLNYKKPRFWVVLAATIAVAAVGIGLLSNPLSSSIEEAERYGIDIKAQGPYSLIYLSFKHSISPDGFVNARGENQYRFNEEIFEITSNIESDRISITNPKYEEEPVGDQIIVMGDMTLDVSEYSDRRCLRVSTPDGSDTGYAICKMDDEVWISHGDWYGEKKDVWWCDYIMKIASGVSAFNSSSSTNPSASGPSSTPGASESSPSSATDASASNPSSATNVATYDTRYNRVKISFLSDMMGFRSADEFETSYFPIVAYIDSTIKASLTPAQEGDLENNHTNKYAIKLSNDIGGYSCGLYYDTLYDKAYIVNDGGLYEAETDFARYIDSFLENTDISVHIDDSDVVALFQTYGWTVDYQISAGNDKLNNIKTLTGFNPNAYYYAYNNELSKDIGLDMSGYSDTANIYVEIYRLHESMPQEFYPIKDCRGIVVKKDGQIIGAFVSAGRHSAFNACSLKRKSFERATGKTLYRWLTDMVKADDTEEKLSRLEPEQIIDEYFKAINEKNAKTAGYCVSRASLLGNLTTNIQNYELFNDGIALPLTASGNGARSTFNNLRSAKLLKAELIDEPDENTKVFRVTVNLKYRKDIIISSGEQTWDCHMVHETDQTGWKIKEFGH